MKKGFAALAVLIAISIPALLCAAELTGIVTGKDGKPAAAKIVLKGADGGADGGSVSSDANGAYSFKDIKPGSYQILVNDKDEGKIFVGPGSTRRDIRQK